MYHITIGQGKIEAPALMLPYLDRRGDFGPDLLAILDQGRLISATDYVAQRLRALYKKRWSELWEEVDFVFTPTTPIQAPFIGQTIVADEDVRLASTRLVSPPMHRACRPYSIPLVSTNNLPMGLQEVGKFLCEQELLRIAHHFQNMLDYVTQNTDRDDWFTYKLTRSSKNGIQTKVITRKLLIDSGIYMPLTVSDLLTDAPCLSPNRIVLMAPIE